MCWTWLALALELRHRGYCVVGPGVAVIATENGTHNGEHVAHVYGGYRSRVDVAAATEAARAALADWPYEISALNVGVDPDPPRNSYTRRGRAVKGLPS